MSNTNLTVFKNVKGVAVKLFFNGDGCVNYDSSDQKHTLIKLGIQSYLRDNVKLAKKTFLTDENNKVVFKYKVSSECIRHACFKDEIAFENSRIADIPIVLYKAIASPALVLRGYMFTGDNTIRKKSPVTITAATELGANRTVCDMEVHSTSGERDSTSLYYTENVGKSVYTADAHINLGELQFISNDTSYDRCAVGVDGGENENIYLTEMRKFYGDDVHFDYYYMKNGLTQDEWAERGILLSKESVDFLTKNMLRRFFDINIYTHQAYFTFDHMEVKVICNNEGRFEEHIIELKNADDVDSFFFDYFSMYELADEGKIMANKEKLDMIKAAQKEAEKNEKKKAQSKKTE